MPTPTTPPSMTAPPPAPNRNNPSVFRVRMDDFLAWLVAWVTQLADVAANVFGNALISFDSAAAAAASAAASLGSSQAAASSAQSSAASAGATAWVSGTSYAIGDARWSPADGRVYRRRTAGAGTTDPSADPTNWSAISANGLQLATVSGTSATVTANTDTRFSNSAACAATVPSLAVGESIVIRFDNGRLDNSVDLGARSMVGPNGVICSGVITLNIIPLLALRWWGDYYRSN